MRLCIEKSLLNSLFLLNFHPLISISWWLLPAAVITVMLFQVPFLFVFSLPFLNWNSPLGRVMPSLPFVVVIILVTSGCDVGCSLF